MYLWRGKEGDAFEHILLAGNDSKQPDAKISVELLISHEYAAIFSWKVLDPNTRKDVSSVGAGKQVLVVVTGDLKGIRRRQIAFTVRVNVDGNPIRDHGIALEID